MMFQLFHGIINLSQYHSILCFKFSFILHEKCMKEKHSFFIFRNAFHGKRKLFVKLFDAAWKEKFEVQWCDRGLKIRNISTDYY